MACPLTSGTTEHRFRPTTGASKVRGTAQRAGPGNEPQQHCMPWTALPGCWDPTAPATGRPPPPPVPFRSSSPLQWEGENLTDREERRLEEAAAPAKLLAGQPRATLSRQLPSRCRLKPLARPSRPQPWPPPDHVVPWSGRLRAHHWGGRKGLRWRKKSERAPRTAPTGSPATPS